MVNQNEHLENIVILYLKGQATPEQALQLEEWIAESEENQKAFKAFQEVVSMTHGIDEFQIENKADVWRKIRIETTKKPAKILSIAKRSLFLAAAIFVITFISSKIWFQETSNSVVTSGIKTITTSNVRKNSTLTAMQEVESFLLSDQSMVKLSKGSELVFNEKFNVTERNLTLKGSGEFNVIHNEDKPFILHVNQLKIIDIGTIFRVRSGSDTVRVIVDEGEVQLKLNNQVLSISAGDSAFYVIRKDVISKYPKKKDRRNKVFIFDGTNLKEVVEVLSDFFEQPIVIKNKEIENCPLTVRFKNENLITILGLIEELMDIKVLKNKEVIELYGKGCN